MTRSPIYLIMLLVLLAILAACAPASPPAGAPTAAPAPFIGQTSPLPTAETAAPTLAATGDSAPVDDTGPGETDAAGLPVGFTAEGRPYRGDPHAPVMLEAFSDFQCPYCGQFSEETLPGLLANQVAAGQAVFIFYDFPLDSIHPQAAAAANAARCAGEAGAAAYWAMHDRLFADIDAWANDGAAGVFRTYGAELGLDETDFVACLDENRYAEAIAADQALGARRGVGSTPTFFVNDQVIEGAYPLATFDAAITAAAAGEPVAAAPAAAPAVAPTPATIVYDDVAAAIGEANAPITIVEYTDYQCPYCARHAIETLPTMLAEMIETGRARYLVKDFPLDSIHAQARAAAVAARCAGEQDAYWPMHDALFARQAEWGVTGANDVFATMAGELGLDGDAFGECLAAGRYDAVIQANLDEGLLLGVNGTPGFFINGFPISGAQPYDLFDYAVGLAEQGTLADAYVQPEQAAAPEPQGPVEVDTSQAFSIGAADAPVVIVEFTDFQCPYCSRHFEQTFPQLQADYVETGKVRYVFMDFPLTDIHPQAPAAAEAARCAGEQDAYLEMHHALFTRQGEWSGRGDAAAIFADYAAELGLDEAAFAACQTDGRFADAVQADLEQGVALGVNGTPAFFLNGHFVSGAQPYSVFQEAIESLLAEG